MERGKGEEGSANYVQGGYHPVDRGDLFNGGRYVVQSKLGWGAFSTVWLAWDTQLNKYVALKITRSKVSFRERARREVRILKFIAKNDPEDKQCVVKLLDDFTHTGPNGNHVCLVLEHLGDDLRTLLKHYNNGIPLHKVKEICFHILTGLGFLHEKLSIIHTDLKPENILLPSTIDPEKDTKIIGAPFIPSCSNGKSTIVTSSSSASMTGNQQRILKQNGKSVAQDCGHAANDEEEKLGGQTEARIVTSSSYPSMAGNQQRILKQNGKSVAQDCGHAGNDEEEKLGGQTEARGSKKILYDALKGNPVQRFKELRINSPSEKQELIESLDLKCKIADLGNALKLPNELMGPIQTFRYKCPETILGSAYSTPADLWSVACIAYELATGEFLFDPHGENKQEKDVNHLGLMMELVGVMPRGVALGGKLSREYFDNKGQLRGYRKLKSRPLIRELRDKYGFAKSDAYDFRKFLFSLLDFDPEWRPTAMQAIHHPWLNPVSRLLQSLSSSLSTPQNDQKECDEVISEENTPV